MELIDFIIVPVYLIIIYGVAYFIKATVLRQSPLRSYFIPGLSVKLLGAFLFVLIYKYYYGYGDSITYYTSASYLTENFFKNPFSTLKALITPLNQYNDTLSYLISKSPSNVAFRSESNFMVVRIGTLLNLFGRTYLMTNLLFATISYIGIWKLLVACHKLYPRLHKGLAISILFVPTVFFWGSPMMKDSITIAALCYLFYSANEVLIWNRNILLNILLAIICVILLVIVKMYILVAFIPAYFTFISFKLINKIRSIVIRVYALPLFLMLLIITSIYTTTQIGAMNRNYRIENLSNSIGVIQRDILRNSSNDAAYSFGEIQYTPLGIAKIFPLAVATTLYRPFIWEVRNPVMLLSAIENAILIFFSLLILFRLGITKIIKTVRKDPFLHFCIIYTMVLGFTIGLSTYNFGTLARYKAPLMPFVAISIVILLGEKQHESKNQLFHPPFS